MIFIRLVPEENRKTKLLYLNGATSHTHSMFLLKSSAENLSDVLFNNNIESYTFNYYGTGHEDKPEFIEDSTSIEIEKAIKLVNDYGIEYIFAYSYGCLVGRQVALECPNLKGLVLIDPHVSLNLSFEILNNSKIKFTDAHHVANLVENGATICHEIYQDYIRGFVGENELITASYPGKYFTQKSYLFKTKEHVDSLYETLPLKVFFTKNSLEEVRKLYREYTYYPEASHWVLVEGHMAKLMQEVVEFIDSTNKYLEM